VHDVQGGPGPKQVTINGKVNGEIKKFTTRLKIGIKGYNLHIEGHLG